MCWYNNNSVKIGYKNNYAHPYFNPSEDSNWYEGNEIWKNRYTNQNKSGTKIRSQNQRLHGVILYIEFSTAI